MATCLPCMAKVATMGGLMLMTPTNGYNSSSEAIRGWTFQGNANEINNPYYGFQTMTPVQYSGEATYVKPPVQFQGSLRDRIKNPAKYANKGTSTMAPNSKYRYSPARETLFGVSLGPLDNIVDLGNSVTGDLLDAGIDLGSQGVDLANESGATDLVKDQAAMAQAQQKAFANATQGLGEMLSSPSGIYILLGAGLLGLVLINKIAK